MRWFERLICMVLGCLFPAVVVAGTSTAAEITVAAALSLKAPFEEIGQSFEKKHTGSKVVFNFAASGVLQKQIEAGAPVDVFASASPKEMDALGNAGLHLAGTRADFAGNSIVLITAAKGQARFSSFSDLRKKELGKIAIGNPSTVPAGAYAEESLKAMNLLPDLKARLVYGEHVRQVMDYVARGEVEAGVVFLTDAMSRSGELKVVAEAPASTHKPVVYAIAAVKGTKHEKEARNFISMVVSVEGREVLRKHGFKAAR